MSLVWCGLILASLIYGAISGNIAEVSQAALEGAGAAVELCLGLTGVTCLWCGVMALLEGAGAVSALSRLMAPVLVRLFPSTRGDPSLREAISANVAANMLGLGNAATPLGLRAMSIMDRGDGRASDEMCRFVVLNTASIQLIPTTVAAIRASAGSSSPFGILPAVWLTSVLSVAVGMAASFAFGRLGKR